MTEIFGILPIRPDWEQWAIGIALAVSTRADCTRRQVGAVVLDSQHRPVSFGYNGYPAGRPGCLSDAACPRGRLTHDELAPDSPYVGLGVSAPCGAIHAEENALLYADPVRRQGGLMAISHAPCPSCRRLLAGSGIARAVWPDDSWDVAG